MALIMNAVFSASNSISDYGSMQNDVRAKSAKNVQQHIAMNFVAQQQKQPLPAQPPCPACWRTPVRQADLISSSAFWASHPQTRSTASQHGETLWRASSGDDPNTLDLYFILTCRCDLASPCCVDSPCHAPLSLHGHGHASEGRLRWCNASWPHPWCVSREVCSRV
jgi:hypothetical protein